MNELYPVSFMLRKVIEQRGLMNFLEHLRVDVALSVPYRAKYDHRAGRAGSSTARAHPTDPERGQQDRTRDDSQVQPRVQIIRKFMAMRQVHGQTAKSIHRSGARSALVRITRVRHTPAILMEVQSDDTGLTSSWEVSLQVGVQTNGIHSQAWACLQLSWRPTSYSVAQAVTDDPELS